MSHKTPVANGQTPAADSAPIAVDAQDRTEFGDTLHCPRCNYNLRGLTGDRCPECGLTLDWDSIIAAARRRVEAPTFEYQWRQRPVASFFGTLWLSIQPWKLWKRIPLTSDPRPGALLFFVALTPCAHFVLWIYLLALCDLATWVSFRVHLGRNHHTFMQLFGTSAAVRNFMQSYGMRYAILLGLGILVYAALCLFQESLLSYRIRRNHLLRIGVLVFACLFTIQSANDTFRWTMMSLLELRVPGVHYLWPYAGHVVDLIFLALPTWSIVCAARDYLQVRRPWQIGIVILVLGYLVAITVSAVYCVIVESLRNMLTRKAADMWPGLDFATQCVSGWLGFR